MNKHLKHQVCQPNCPAYSQPIPGNPKKQLEELRRLVADITVWWDASQTSEVIDEGTQAIHTLYLEWFDSLIGEDDVSVYRDGNNYAYNRNQLRKELRKELYEKSR